MRCCGQRDDLHHLLFHLLAPQPIAADNRCSGWRISSFQYVYGCAGLARLCASGRIYRYETVISAAVVPAVTMVRPNVNATSNVNVPGCDTSIVPIFVPEPVKLS